VLVGSSSSANNKLRDDDLEEKKDRIMVRPSTGQKRRTRKVSWNQLPFGRFFQSVSRAGTSGDWKQEVYATIYTEFPVLLALATAQWRWIALPFR